MCYIFSMKQKHALRAPRRGKTRRPGATVTFSVSLAKESKRALRALADRDFGGNLSALVTDFAGEARRRLAAGEYLRDHGIAPLRATEIERLEAQIEHEVATVKRRKRRRAA